MCSALSCALLTLHFFYQVMLVENTRNGETFIIKVSESLMEFISVECPEQREFAANEG